jgi:HD-GYP domain-containing protein (c-di-GMP phosphodiesterase class II)
MSTTTTARTEEELGAMRWVLEEVAAGRTFPAAESKAIVQCLHVALHAHDPVQIELVPLRDAADYPATHALNVSLLAMATTEFTGHTGADVLAVGLAGLLHDIGSIFTLEELLTKATPLTDDERQQLKQHPILGARAVLASEDNLDLAAIAAYEHHVRMDGGGYPAFRYPRDCHTASRLIQICDVFDAMRTPRPYKKAWPDEMALSFIEERAGFEFQPELARSFVAMLKAYLKQ